MTKMKIKYDGNQNEKWQWVEKLTLCHIWVEDKNYYFLNIYKSNKMVKKENYVGTPVAFNKFLN